MIWWYNDIFISRGSNLQIEHSSPNIRKRAFTMRKRYARLKSAIRSVIEFHRKRRLKRHSYLQLSRLEDHYLADIGLIDEDLYVLRKGFTPIRFQKKAVESTKAADFRLISCKSAVDQTADYKYAEPVQIDKAA